MFVKVGSQFFQIHNTYSRNGPNVFNFAKVVKFYQIWSHFGDGKYHYTADLMFNWLGFNQASLTFI